MLAALRRRADREEEGFTLIELMVVVLIIAILIAIAVPTFLGARQKAQARAAQSNVRNAYSAAKTNFTDYEMFSSTGTAAQAVTELQLIEPSLKFDTAINAGDPKQIAVRVADSGTTVCLSAQGGDKSVYTLRDISGPTSSGVTYAKTAAGVLPACDSTTTTGYDSKW